MHHSTSINSTTVTLIFTIVYTVFQLITYAMYELHFQIKRVEMLLRKVVEWWPTPLVTFWLNMLMYAFLYMIYASACVRIALFRLMTRSLFGAVPEAMPISHQEHIQTGSQGMYKVFLL